MNDRILSFILTFLVLAVAPALTSAQTDGEAVPPPDPFAAPSDESQVEAEPEAEPGPEAQPEVTPEADPQPEVEPEPEPEPEYESAADEWEPEPAGGPMEAGEPEDAGSAAVANMVVGAVFLATGAATLPWWISRRNVLEDTCPCLDQEKISRRRWAALATSFGSLALGTLFLIYGVRLKLSGSEQEGELALELRGNGVGLSGTF